MDIGRMLTWTADRYPGRTAVADPRMVVADDTTSANLAQALGHEPFPLVTLDELARREPDGELETSTEPEDLSVILYSSGTTGRPKGVPRAHRAEHAAAGAPMTPSLAEELNGTLHPEVFVDHFGSTEIYTFTICPGARKKPGCAGRAGVFSRVGLVDPLDPAAEVPRGTQGQVAVSMASPEAFAGYRNRPDADARAIRDGWYLTGDLATEDGDGDLWVSGRVDDMINSGGENLYPDEIEGALARCPAVSAVVVVGLPDDRWGQAVTAFVVPAQDFYPERALSQLSHYARDGSGLASVKRPKRYIAVERIPTSAVGKILRRELTEGRYHLLTSALAEATDQIAATIRIAGAALLEADPDELELAAGLVRHKNDHERSVTFRHAAGLVHWDPGSLRSAGHGGTTPWHPPAA